MITNKKESIVLKEEKLEVVVYLRTNLGNFYLPKKLYYFYFDTLFGIFGIHYNSQIATLNTLRICKSIEFNKSMKIIEEENLKNLIKEEKKKEIEEKKKSNPFSIFKNGEKRKPNTFKIIFKNGKKSSFNSLNYHQMYIDLITNKIDHQIFSYVHNKLFNHNEDHPTLVDPNQWKPMEANFRSMKNFTYKISEIKKIVFYFNKNVENQIEEKKKEIEEKKKTDKEDCY